MRYEELEGLVNEEVTQREEEGCDVAGARKALEGVKRKSRTKLETILKDINKLSPRTDFPYTEPSDLEGIRAERPKGPRKINLKLSDEQAYDKIYGGWLGRCAGCLLGKPVEGMPKEQIEEWLKLTDAYPLSDYFPPLPED